MTAPDILACAHTPQALLDQLSKMIAEHSRKFSIQCSCSSRFYPQIFCITQLRDGSSQTIAHKLGGETRGVGTTVAFLTPPTDFECSLRDGAGPLKDCYNCHLQVSKE